MKRRHLLQTLPLALLPNVALGKEPKPLLELTQVDRDLIDVYEITDQTRFDSASGQDVWHTIPSLLNRLGIPQRPFLPKFIFGSQESLFSVGYDNDPQRKGGFVMFFKKSPPEGSNPWDYPPVEHTTLENPQGVQPLRSEFKYYLKYSLTAPFEEVLSTITDETLDWLELSYNHYDHGPHNTLGARGSFGREAAKVIPCKPETFSRLGVHPFNLQRFWLRLERDHALLITSHTLAESIYAQEGKVLASNEDAHKFLQANWRD